MTKIEQAHFDYLKAQILPILEGYVDGVVSSATIRKMQDEIIDMLRGQLIEHNWEVIVEEKDVISAIVDLEDRLNKQEVTIKKLIKLLDQNGFIK